MQYANPYRDYSVSTQISTNYRQLAPDEVIQIAAECAKAWQDPAIPRRQYELATKGELESFRNGGSVAPFDALVKCFRQLPITTNSWMTKLLDVGASSGYYSEVVRMKGFLMQYTGCDFSPAFKKLAEELYPDIAFDVEDARKLPYRDDWFDVVLCGATIMHVAEYPKVIAEVARVASRYVIFHRTPIVDGPTKYYVKDAYSVPCLEIHFNELELMSLFRDHGLRLLYVTNVFWNGTSGHRSYLLAKESRLNHVQV